MIGRSEVLEFISNKQHTMKQKQIVCLWFIEVWGFNIVKLLSPPLLYNNNESEIELKFRIILILA